MWLLLRSTLTITRFLNDTWVFNTSAAFCGALSVDSEACLTLRGGEYNPNESSTVQPQANVFAAGADEGDTQDLSQHVPFSAWVTDSLDLDEQTTLTDYPIGMVDEDFAGPYITQVCMS